MKKHLRWLPNVLAAVILLQTLSFKFTGHPQSVELFTELNLLGLPESMGRIGTGVAELVASVLMFHKRSEMWGGLGVVALMAGALFFHMTKLGFDGANGQLAMMAGIALICGGFTAWRAHKA